MPEVVNQSIEILSNGGLGMAMFSLGKNNNSWFLVIMNY